ncbi:20S proteasome, regulatory subunit beta type PSMB5/PSMB8/PRE2 [Trachipleistophora hominis]|uniref:Proteasome subunit beta n=1 Tax=Trachipleistophora hominis TaxID=72359 RepID=L7JUW1_TRAHO|nr:20S proteasome, regulatory subunit beta type PSMB5/PSMB8/PRE2 [Trachipleistophora hominis]
MCFFSKYFNPKTFCPLMPSTNIQDMFFDKEALRNDVDYQKINDMVKPFKGTTTLAFIFKEGIAIAVDSRATSGSYIASRTVHKVIRVNNYLLTTMAGGAADCLYWEKRMGAFAKLYEVTNGKRLPVPAAVNYLRNCIVGRRGLSIGTMVCGWDDKGPNIYYLDNDGTMVKGTVFSVGSGSTIAYGLLNSNYRYDMSRDEGLKLARDAIFYATYRDAYSGGFVNLYFMDNNGWQHVGQYDVNGLYEELIENK